MPPTKGKDSGKNKNSKEDQKPKEKKGGTSVKVGGIGNF